MRSRTVREGSVGLLILVSLFLFGGLIFWIRDIRYGKKSYTIIAEFANVGGMQQGASVRYRGVNVGQITAINPRSNGVDVTMEISPADLVMPNEVVVEANQSGLLSETSIDINPLKQLPPEVKVALPLDPQCPTGLIVCNNERVRGQIGISFDELLRSTTRIANLYNDPTLLANLKAATKNTSDAAVGVAQLTRDFSGLSATVQQEIKTFSGAANAVTRAANQSSAQLSQIGGTANQFGLAANQITRTANQYSLTATQLNQLLGNVNSLVVENRSTLLSTLDNFSTSSLQLRTTVNSLTGQVNQFGNTELRRNLEVLSANAAQASVNAAQASANLRDLTTALNSPTNLVVLQQTLDSARTTFENAQKITSDLDDLTGDQAFRNNLRNLVNGLSGLVSSTQQLEQQVQIAEVLEPARAAINTQVAAGKMNKDVSSSFSSSPLTNIKAQKQLKSNPIARPKAIALPPAYWHEESTQPAADFEKKK